MIKIYCDLDDIGVFCQCLSYDTTNNTCKKYKDECSDCPYYNYNIDFVKHDSSRVMIETDELDLDIETCLYNTFYNYYGCGMVDLNKKETCTDCRFYYENIEIIKIKKGEIEK